MNRAKAFALVALVLLIGSSTRAAILSVSEDTGDFGYNDQNHADNGANGPVACAPTATVNSFQYLQASNPWIPGIENLAAPNPYDTINALEGAGYMDIGPGGVSATNLVQGKQNWINDAGLSDYITVHGQAGGTTGVPGIDADLASAGSLTGMENVAPTAQFLYDQLAAGQDVEIAFLWWDPTLNDGDGGYAGGHVVTATGITFDTDTGIGTINFIDPWGAVSITATLTGVMNNSFMQITYTGGAAGDENGGDPDEPDDNPNNLAFADIAMVVAESPVPEPTTVSVLILVGVTVAMRRRAHRADIV